MDAFLRDVARVAAELEAPLVSAGGSAYFDRVAEHLPGAVLRSGCYLTHDMGSTSGVSAARSAARPAPVERVLSVPEPGLAIAGSASATRRTTSSRRAAGVLDRAPPDGLRVETINDQHAFLRYDGGELRVGDLVICGISHPVRRSTSGHCWRWSTTTTG